MRSSAAAEHNRAPTLTFGKASHPGHGHANQDAVAAGWNAAGDVLAAALADGIASSEVSGEAASAAVDGFVVDYHCAPAAWSAEVAGRHVLTALNAGLHARTLDSRYRQDMNRGYVCACSALVGAGSDADLFQVGDTQIFRRRDGALDVMHHGDIIPRVERARRRVLETLHVSLVRSRREKQRAFARSLSRFNLGDFFILDADIKTSPSIRKICVSDN